MRQIIIVLLLFAGISLNAQDKIYLKDNSIIQGKIIEMDDKKICVQQIDIKSKNIPRKDISVIIFENGQSLVIKSKTKDKSGLPEWSIGTNILQPIDGYAGLMIEKNIKSRYSIRIGQSFLFSRYYGFASTTSFLNNFYIGKGKVKWLNSIGLNLEYYENQYSIYQGPYIYITDLIWPYPQDGFNTNLEVFLTLGTGIYFNLTKHLSFTTQFHINYSYLNNFESYLEIDLINTGFSFFYKF